MLIGNMSVATVEYSFVELFPCALPLHRLIRSSRQPPRHPLLRSAILYFLACTSSSNSVSSSPSISTSTSTSTPTPRPSSLISFSPMTRRMIIKMLEQNLSLITQNNNTRPEIASIESLLIVSLSPPYSNSAEGSNNGKSNPNLGLSIAIEPYNAGALALDLAKRLGLDDSMRVVVRERDGSGLDQWDTTGSLNRLCLVS
jgi:hypothetical protein